MAIFSGLDDNPTFVEGTASPPPPPTTVGAPVVLDDDAVIEAAGYDGAVLTLARHGGANPDDVFGGGGSLSLSEGQVLLQETVSGQSIDIIVGTYTNADGTLVITFNADATEARVNAVLEQLTYGNGSESPPPSVTIDFTFDDGQAPATGSITVAITPTNDPPTLDSVAPAASYRPGTPGVVLSPAVAVGDPDNTTLAKAEVTITDGLAGDVLSADPGGTGITVNYDSGRHVLTLSGPHTLDQYRQVLDTVAYSSTDADPSSGGANPTRNIEWQLNDGGTADNLSAVQTTTLTFTPSLDLDGSAAGDGFSTAFTENGASVPVADTDAVVTSPGGGLTFARVVLTNAAPGDSLAIAGPLPGGITGSVDTSTPGQITVVLSGAASAASYQAALRQVVFGSASDNPGTTPRDIIVVVGDAAESSNTAHTTIAIAAVNDAPAATITPASYAATENIGLDLKGNGLAVADVDGNAGSETVTLSVTEGVLNVTTGTSGAVVSNSGTSAVTITGTVAQINALLNTDGASTVSYVENDDTPSATATLTLAIDDNGSTGGGSLTASDTATINITAVNDAPTDITGGPLSINEYSAAGTLVGTVTGHDPENQSLTYTLTDDAGGRFAINGAGQITVVQGLLLDYEQAHFHTIKVQVSDGTTPLEKSFVVAVNDVDPEDVSGSPGDDVIWSGSGADLIRGGDGNDVVHAGSGNDQIAGGDGNDLLYGHDGNDAIQGGLGNDELSGGDDNDYLSGDDGNDVLTGGDGNDALVGGDGIDYLVGGPGNDELLGGNGNDALVGGDGADYMLGGEGNDELLGGIGNDLLSGENGNDYLVGGAGNDELYGGVGNDVLIAGPGGDFLAGGAGDDFFIFRAAEFVAGEFDVVHDYGHAAGNSDTIELYDQPFAQYVFLQQGPHLLISLFTLAGSGGIVVENTTFAELHLGLG
jgi:Ca2+-binding RTX toxin-like protein